MQAFLGAALATLLATQSTWTEQTELNGSTTLQHDVMGTTIALFGDTAVVGAIGDDTLGSQAGAAYVFRGSGGSWTEEAKLLPSQGGSNKQFGRSVALWEDTAVVGAGAFANTEAAVYVYVRSGTTWSEQAALVLSDSAPDNFGAAVALEGDRLMVGTYVSNAPSQTGRVFVYERSRTTWNPVQVLEASDGEMGDLFGYSIALQGDTAMIGAPAISGLDTGFVYVFRRVGGAWIEDRKLIGSNALVNDRFGIDVALSGDTLLVGAEQVGFQTPPNGKAYVFREIGGQWVEEALLLASNGLSADTFGDAVALEGDIALVGAESADAYGLNAGAAYVFRRYGTSWVEETPLHTANIEVDDAFGCDVALQGGTALVGAFGQDLTLGNEGAVYVFTTSQPPPEAYCTAGTSASGCQVLLSASGTASATAPSGFTLNGPAAEGDKFGIFFFGTSGRQANPWGNGTSLRCVVPPVVRTGLLAGGGTPGACDGVYARDLNADWCPSCPTPGKNPSAGALVQAQLWYRDPFSTSNQTTSLSDAIEFVVGP